MKRFKLRKNKFGNKPTTYNGIRFKSQLEVKYAKRLDLLKKAGEVLDWSYESEPCKLPLWVNGTKVCTYKIDFYVKYSDRIEYVEVKGVQTDVWRLKWKLAHILYPDYNFVLVTKSDV